VAPEWSVGVGRQEVVGLLRRLATQ